VALLEAHLRGDEAAVNELVDATNEGDLFRRPLVSWSRAFGEERVADPTAREKSTRSAECLLRGIFPDHGLLLARYRRRLGVCLDD
jgi:hypothetical protein